MNNSVRTYLRKKHPKDYVELLREAMKFLLENDELTQYGRITVEAALDETENLNKPSRIQE